MSIDLNRIISLMDAAELSPSQRGPVLSLAVARALGYALPLPTSKVDDPIIFYTTNDQSVVDMAISQINEEVAINVSATCSLTKAIWLFRYRLVYDSCNPTVREFMDAAMRVGSTEFPGYVSELMISLPANQQLLEYIASLVKDGIKEEVN